MAMHDDVRRDGPTATWDQGPSSVVPVECLKRAYAIRPLLIREACKNARDVDDTGGNALDAKMESAYDSPLHLAGALRAARMRPAPRPRRSVLLLVVALVVGACTTAPAPPPGERGGHRCDRNGDYEERVACRP